MLMLRLHDLKQTSGRYHDSYMSNSYIELVPITRPKWDLINLMLNQICKSDQIMTNVTRNSKVLLLTCTDFKFSTTTVHNVQQSRIHCSLSIQQHVHLAEDVCHVFSFLLHTETNTPQALWYQSPTLLSIWFVLEDKLASAVLAAFPQTFNPSQLSIKPAGYTSSAFAISQSSFFWLPRDLWAFRQSCNVKVQKPINNKNFLNLFIWAALFEV